MRSEFDNESMDRPTLIDHLHKMQLARCNEFLIYDHQIAVKYNSEGAYAWSSMTQRNHESVNNSAKWIRQRLKSNLPFTLMTEQEKYKYLQKLDRVLSTKYEFELFGGDYEKYQ